MVGSSSFSGPLLHQYIDGRGDEEHTWDTVPVHTWPMQRRLLPEDGVHSKEAPFSCQRGDDGRCRWVTDLDHYIHRPLQLRNTSAYVFFTWFRVQKKDAVYRKQQQRRSGTRAHLRLPMAPTHPQAKQMMARKRDRPALPQLLSDPPAVPDDNASPAEGHERYAAYVLSLLVPDFTVEALRASHPDDTLWDTL